jgi:hypothetical protein
MERTSAVPEGKARSFSPHGWLGLGLIAVFWYVNWAFTGLRTHWAFFPLWLGYCLTVDAVVLYRTGTSLLARDPRKYAALFLISAPAWWLFEILNWRLQNWSYYGSEKFAPYVFFLSATLSFTTVIPAVFGSAELAASFGWFRRPIRGPVIRPTRRMTAAFFCAGLVMLVLMWVWPQIFFPFVWISIFFMLEPLNIWLGNRSLANWTERGDWRPVLALWAGVLLTAFFWEMWNFFSYPKWLYSVPWGNCCKVFEMPLLGYGGYLPFALELYALYHLVMGLAGRKKVNYFRFDDEGAG